MNWIVKSRVDSRSNPLTKRGGVSEPTAAASAADFSIGEMARRVGLSVHALRFYEREGIMVNPVRRGHGGQRRYTEADVDWLTVCLLLRASGMSIPDIRHYTDLVRDGEGNEQARLALLRQHRTRVHEQLAELERCLDLIEFKIGVYEDIIEATGSQS